jgi:hypothetical protein
MQDDIGFFNSLYIFLGKIGTALLLIPFPAAFRARKYLNKPLKLLCFYLISLVAVNIFEQLFIWSATEHYDVFWKPILAVLKIGDTNFLNILSRLTDFVFVGWIFSFAVNISLAEKLKTISSVLFFVIILVYFFVDGYQSYGTINAILNRSYLVAIPVVYFWYIFNSLPVISLWKNPYFLFGLGLFIPNLFGLFLSFAGDKLNETDYVAFVKVSIFRNLLAVLAQFLFALAFMRARYAKYLSDLV